MKTLRCRDLGFDCEHEIRAATDEEVVQQAAAHGRAVHGVEVTLEMATQLTIYIRDAPQDANGRR